MYCAIIGEIICTSFLSYEQRCNIELAFNRIFDYINNTYSKYIQANFCLLAGDEFEGLLSSQQIAPKIIQELIMCLYEENITVRISSATGALTVISNMVSCVDGSAFHSARNELNRLQRANSSHWFQISMQANAVEQTFVNNYLSILTALTKNWTKNQVHIVWMTMKNKNNYNLASKQLGISVLSLTEQLKVARFEEYLNAWSYLEQHFNISEQISPLE